MQAALPPATPTPTPDIRRRPPPLWNIPATVAAGIQATTEAQRKPTPTLLPTVTPILLPTPSPAPTPTPLPTPTPTPTPTPLPTPTPRPTLSPTPTSAPSPRIESLRQFALDLINHDRADHGLPPVILGTNPAAQLHAEDMLHHSYQGHWWADGRKPYMVYTQHGGTSYVSENAASSGWTDSDWHQANCDSLLVQCRVPMPVAAITELQFAMMHDDAHADWGHRDNILGKNHQAVNIGVASNGRLVIFVQHFEGGDVEAKASPSLSPTGSLSFSLIKRRQGVEVGGVVSIHYDPLPTPKTSQQIDALDSYCVGGGFSNQCGEPVARILAPLPPGLFYTDLLSNDVVADAWTETTEAFSFTASLGSLATTTGVYTITIWRDSRTGQFSDVLAQLTAVQP